MNRQVIDLGTERNEEVQQVYEWEYLYIGSCDGDVVIRLGHHGSPLNPEEFDKITDISDVHFIYLTNTAQSGKELVIYFTEKKHLWVG